MAQQHYKTLFKKALLQFIPVTLPGANGKPLYTFLDSAFYPSVTAFIDLCSFWGIQLEFTSGYRTQRQQDDIRKADPNAALKSVHSTGWAVDINWNGLGWLERIVVPFYGRILGFIWGGTAFGKYYDPVHFQITPPGGTRQSWIDQAAEDYVLYFYGLPDMTPMEIYMRYGVFTVSAAEKIICGSI